VQKRLVALMNDVFGVPIAGATLEGMSRACAARLKEFAARKTGRARCNDCCASPVMPRTSRANAGVPLKPGLIACMERRFDAIVAAGLAFHENQTPLARAPAKRGGKTRGRAPRRTGHNLLLRFLTRRDDTLRFLRDPAVPFTNNQAERDLRMMKLRIKISGGFRSIEGAVDFATIRGSLSTARKQGWNIIDALRQNPEELAKTLTLA
jgi:hypothetical protein